MWLNRPTLGSLWSWRMWSTFKGSWPISASCVGVKKCVDTNSGYSGVFGFGLIYHIAQSWRLLSHTHAAVFGLWNRVPPAMVLETGRVSQQAPQQVGTRWRHTLDTTQHHTTPKQPLDSNDHAITQHQDRLITKTTQKNRKNQPNTTQTRTQHKTWHKNRHNNNRKQETWNGLLGNESLIPTYALIGFHPKQKQKGWLKFDLG